MNAIEINNITKTYGDNDAVKDLSFVVEKNSICGFLGPNGAGKTTTFKLIAGLINLTEGDIKIFGKDVSAKTNEIRFLKDVPEFYHYMSAKEYLEFICQINDIKDAKSVASETLTLVGLDNTTNMRISAFSRGMKQRLGIAASIIPNPKILLLDEPVSALDPIGRKEVFDLLSKLKGKMTILFSTHIIDDIERISDKIVVIDKGQKILDGTAEEIKNNHLSSNLIITFTNEEEAKSAAKTLKVGNPVQSGNTVTVTDKDLNKLQTDVFKQLVKTKTLIQKFEICSPSLEEIFMREVTKWNSI